MITSAATARLIKLTAWLTRDAGSSFMRSIPMVQPRITGIVTRRKNAGAHPAIKPHPRPSLLAYAKNGGAPNMRIIHELWKKTSVNLCRIKAAGETGDDTRKGISRLI